MSGPKETALPAAWANAVGEKLATRDAGAQRRHLVPVPPGAPGTGGARGAGGMRLFSSNDYLGLAGHPAVREAVAEAAREHGMGPRGAALVCGHTTLHETLAMRLAALEGTEAALLAPTGWAANTALLGALADADVTFVSDALNHASIIDGLRMARRTGAAVRVTPHGDAAAVEAALAERDTPRAVVVTDGVFSMDGDVAPLAALREAADAHGAILVVDEAHGTLVLGETGAGACEAAGVRADVVVGTLSKAVGAMGGFVAGNRTLCDLVLNLGRAQIYSTALPVPVVAGALAALDVAARTPALRERLRAHQARFAEALGRPVPTPIVPWVLGDEDAAMGAAASLRAAGMHVVAIRPPTVPEGTSRLRITLSAVHTDADVEDLLTALGQGSTGDDGGHWSAIPRL
ncbi:MAG: 8-amino-7-oxononanoate synthase [Deltaproteobacteria bacterium]|nr:MAG: 8-amino-7-oxononanoate synthase [Deltaproteobacteria bacterium]